jgi:hypothetical protein
MERCGMEWTKFVWLRVGKNENGNKHSGSKNCAQFLGVNVGTESFIAEEKTIGR